MLTCFNNVWNISWFVHNCQADGKNVSRFKQVHFLLLYAFLEKDIKISLITKFKIKALIKFL